MIYHIQVRLPMLEANLLPNKTLVRSDILLSHLACSGLADVCERLWQRKCHKP